MAEVGRTKTKPQRIGDYTSPLDLGVDVHLILKKACINLGLQCPDVNTADGRTFISTVASILSKRYKDFSLRDVHEAFELLVSRDLDSFLPKDKNGQPERNHYGNFSVDFVFGILSAYRKMKTSRAPAKVLLEVKESPEELWKNRTAFLSTVCTWVDEEFPKPYHRYDDYLYQQFIEWGLVPVAGFTILCDEYRIKKTTGKTTVMSDDSLRLQWTALINEAAKRIKAENKTLYQIVKEHELTRIAPYNGR